jgi:hypothetical protein
VGGREELCKAGSPIDEVEAAEGVEFAEGLGLTLALRLAVAPLLPPVQRGGHAEGPAFFEEKGIEIGFFSQQLVNLSGEARGRCGRSLLGGPHGFVDFVVGVACADFFVLALHCFPPRARVRRRRILSAAREARAVRVPLHWSYRQLEEFVLWDFETMSTAADGPMQARRRVEGLRYNRRVCEQQRKFKRDN